jgi:Spy/CpxP family protein refolding chaperone
MKKTFIAFVILLSVVALTASVYAIGPGWGRGHGMGQYDCADITSMPGINLTDEQTAKINALRSSHLKDIKPIQDKMFSKRGDLRLLWLEKNPDQDKITATQKEIRALRDQMQDKKTSYRIAILNILTPEQQEKVKSGRMGRGFGPGMRGGIGPQDGPGCRGGGPGMGMGGNR